MNITINGNFLKSFLNAHATLVHWIQLRDVKFTCGPWKILFQALQPLSNVRKMQLAYLIRLENGVQKEMCNYNKMSSGSVCRDEIPNYLQAIDNAFNLGKSSNVTAKYLQMDLHAVTVTLLFRSNFENAI